MRGEGSRVEEVDSNSPCFAVYAFVAAISYDLQNRSVYLEGFFAGKYDEIDAFSDAGRRFGLLLPLTLGMRIGQGETAYTWLASSVRAHVVEIGVYSRCIIQAICTCISWFEKIRT